jgi:hypothetical protein
MIGIFPARGRANPANIDLTIPVHQLVRVGRGLKGLGRWGTTIKRFAFEPNHNVSVNLLN